MPTDKIAILIADDHAILRQGLRRILEAEPDMAVVSEAATGVQAVRQTLEFKPDVVILDVCMPEQDGIDAIREILSTTTCRILILSVFAEQHVISAAVSAGAAGYLVKDTLDTELVSAVRAIMQGGTVFSPGVSRALADGSRSGAHSSVRSLQSLTTREREVFLLLAEGKTPTEVAAELFVSPKTVHTHRQHIIEKLGLRTTTELIRLALREGLIKKL